MSARREHVEYLHRYWKKQKAVGMVAESHFLNHIQDSPIDSISDITLFQPKPAEDEFNPWENIYAFVLDAAENESLSEEGVEAAQLLFEAGTTVIFPSVHEEGRFTSLVPEIENHYRWKWRSFDVRSRSLPEVDIDEETRSWRTGGYSREASDSYLEELVESLETFSDDTVKRLFLKEHFFSHHLKSVHGFTGTYFDIDGFLHDPGTSSLVPYEIKEKAPYLDSGQELFGLDVSRLIVLLRVAMVRGLNPIYVVREVEEAEEYHELDREFAEWRFIPISDLIRSSAWQVQAGGPGMGGGGTQTLMIPKEEFEVLKLDRLNLVEYTDLLRSFKRSI